MKGEIALVIGGGIAGPAMALFLKRAGFQPMVFEAHDGRSDIGGGLQIAPNGMGILSQLTLADGLLKAGVESAEFCFENQFGKKLASIPNGPASLYEHPAIHLSRSVLHSTLLDELQRQEIPIHYSKRLQTISSNEDHVLATFADGSAAAGAFLIGADGIRSQTRQIIFPEAPAPSYTGLITVGGFAEHDALRPNDAKQQTRAHLIFGQNGFFGYGYYDRANPSALMWWSHLQRADEPSAEELRCTRTEALRKRIVDHHRGWAEPVELILQNTSRLLWGPVHDLPDLASWSKGRVALIGDAAHAVSPHAGQGASLALEDAICLASHLRSSAYHNAFMKYQRDRQQRVETIVAEARKRGEGKHSLPPNAARIRDFMLSLFLRFRGKHLFDEAYRYQATW
jgi:2-polyprenyl-6-methoxyphenol hydroxylase-like FAD-dependent oxidoreductase